MKVIESNMEPLIILAKTISDAWFQILWNVLEKGYIQHIQHGSFVGRKRYQLPRLGAYIEYPHMDMIPEFPPHTGIPAPTTMQYVEEYFVEYLMNPELSGNETYRYSSRIHHPMPKGGTQIERVINLLRDSPQTNQAVIEVGSPVDLDVCYGRDGNLDPPCLRILDFKVLPGKIVCAENTRCEDYKCQGRMQCTVPVLSVTAYFRSWDLWAGFPTNLGGIELLK
jgi:thymidylate synthase